MKREFFRVAALVIAVTFSQSLWADSKETTTAAVLASDQARLVDEIMLLGDEITNLRNTITPLQATMEVAKRELKKISSASTQARRHNHTIKQLEPQLKMVSEQLARKLQELDQKLGQFSIVETELQWTQDKVSGPLFKQASRWLRHEDEP